LGTSGRVVVIGLGEVGQPLLELVSSSIDAVGIDVVRSMETDDAPVSVMHVCYPFEIDDFVGETARYIERFAPELTVINSTVAVGTTREVHRRTGAAIAHSPVRGKHARMLEELLRYTKYVGGIDRASATTAAAHFKSLGMETKILAGPEVTELAKLTETTYFGLLIAWAQQLARYCDQVGADYDEVASFYEEIDFFPAVKYFPGVIGGHCVMPNIETLSRLAPSDLLRAIKTSNAQRIEQEAELRGVGVAADASPR
jgi:UDP-N-acetyl-D-mannosaminuronate dehydrogenase